MRSCWSGTGAIAGRIARSAILTLTGRIGIAGTGARTGSHGSRGRGEIEKLKPEYRLALARDCYALVRCDVAVFKPEI
jgi:hypothetical protein